MTSWSDKLVHPLQWRFLKANSSGQDRWIRVNFRPEQFIPPYQTIVWPQETNYKTSQWSLWEIVFLITNIPLTNMCRAPLCVYMVHIYLWLWFVHSRNIHQRQSRHHLRDPPSQSWVFCLCTSLRCTQTRTGKPERPRLQSKRRSQSSQAVYYIYFHFHSNKIKILCRNCFKWEMKGNRIKKNSSNTFKPLHTYKNVKKR